MITWRKIYWLFLFCIVWLRRTCDSITYQLKKIAFDYGPPQVKCWLLSYSIFLNEFPAYFGKCCNLGPTQVKSRLLNYAIFLNEFPAYFGKCQNLIYDISQNMLEIHSKICHNLKVNIWLEVGLNSSISQNMLEIHSKKCCLKSQHLTWVGPKCDFDNFGLIFEG